MKLWEAIVDSALVILSAAITAIVISFALGGCVEYLPFPLDPPVPEGAGDATDCKPACDNLVRLECPGWAGSPGPDGVYGNKDDIACHEVCWMVTSEPTATLFPKCTAEADSCEEIERCFE